LLPQLAGSAVPMQLVTSLFSGKRSLVATGPPPVGVVGGVLAAARAEGSITAVAAIATARIRQVFVTPHLASSMHGSHIATIDGNGAA
jgi:hypothetical protein